MSDSDDTDILLLIPPDFFVAESNLEESFKYDRPDASNIIQSIITTPKRGTSKNILVNGNSTQMDRDASNYGTSPSISNSLKKRNTWSGLDTCHLQSGDTIEAASRVLREFNSVRETEIKTPVKINDDNYLREIDDYLAGYTSSGSKLRDVNAILSSNGITPLSFTDGERKCGRSKAMEIPLKDSCSAVANPSICDHVSTHVAASEAVARNLDGGRMSDWSMALHHQSNVKHDEQLVNLNEIWDADGRNEKIAISTVDIHEEQLRRRQCERQIQSLQRQNKEYQEKFSVAIKIDQTKNEALARLHETNSNLVANITKLEQTISDMELRLHREKDLHIDNNELKIKVQLLDKELLDAVKISKFLQEKNQMLEAKVNHLLQSTNEIRELNRNQLEDIQIRLSNSKHAEDLLNNEILRLKNENVNLRNANDSLTHANENFILEKNRADALDTHNKQIQQQLDTLVVKEKDVMKELEMQRLSLKAYYQAQLEQVVGDKLKEFQQQLDSVEEKLKSEARKNERSIAERAIKQIELINQKNEQEFSLMEEKHKQEIELYRIRLDNAAKTIRQMDEKLKGQRNDIAKRLHNVIESQWQQTLEIISNPRGETTQSAKPRKMNASNNHNSSEMELGHMTLLAGLNLNNAN